MFVCNASVDTNLAFVLADKGYDVWLGNFRGNKYCRTHKKYNVSQNEFWNFSIDELAMVDFPQIVDFVLAQTGKEKLSVIGHSMGSSALIAALSVFEELNHKIDVSFGIGSCTRPKVPENMICSSLETTGLMKLVPFILGKRKQFPFMWFFKLQQTAPYFLKRIVFDNYLWYALNIDVSNLEPKELLYKFALSPTSSKVVSHWFNIFYSDFEHYSSTFSSSHKRTNPLIQNYIQHTLNIPAKFPLRHINVPIHLFYSEHDGMSDVEHWKDFDFKTHVVKDFHHLDFVWRKDAKEKVWDHIIKILDDNCGGRSGFEGKGRVNGETLYAVDSGFSL
jgi:lysosomal acid lipase/cholesteryl ester hydrolase